MQRECRKTRPPPARPTPPPESPCPPVRIRLGTPGARKTPPSRPAAGRAGSCRLVRKIAASQFAIGLPVFFARPQRDLLRQARRGRLLVPVDRFQIVPHVLLVIGGLRAPGLVLIHRPEPR